MTTATKTIAIVFTHMGHPLFPGQPLHPLCGKPLIAHALDPLQQVADLDEVWLVTPYQPVNEPLLLWGLRQNHFTLAFSGDVDDWLGQVDAVLEKSKATRFVPVFADRYPFIDGEAMAHLLASLDSDASPSVVQGHANPTVAWETGLVAFTQSGWSLLKQVCSQAKGHAHPASAFSQDAFSAVVCPVDAQYPAEMTPPSIETSLDIQRVECVLAPYFKDHETVSPKKLAQLLQESQSGEERSFGASALSCESPRILLAVQAGGDFGTGHLARCRTLRQTIEAHYQIPVSMWMDSPSATYREECAEPEDNLVDSHWSLPETLRKSPFSHVVIDFQTPVTPSLIQGIRQVRPDIAVVVLDNDGLGCLEADALIYPNAHSQPSAALLSSPVKVYYGPQYVILGAGFLSEVVTPETSPLHMPSVLISTGGRDPEHISERVLDSVKDLRDCHVDLVVPMMYDQPENLERIATRMSSTVTLHWRIKNLRPLMQRATVAVCAFGVTAYELAHLGVPTILLGHYEYQEPERQRFAQWGSAINLGWGKTVNPEKLHDTVASLLVDAQARLDLREAGLKLVDSHGAQRVIDVVLSTSRHLSRV